MADPKDQQTDAPAKQDPKPTRLKDAAPPPTAPKDEPPSDSAPPPAPPPAPEATTDSVVVEITHGSYGHGGGPVYPTGTKLRVSSAEADKLIALGVAAKA